MKIKSLIAMVVTGLIVAGLTTAAWAASLKYKMTTEIPSSIPIADEIETRFGTLNFTDGSCDIYFGPTKPKGNVNWLQTISGKGWHSLFRLYSPLEPWFDKTWRPGEVELVK